MGDDYPIGTRVIHKTDRVPGVIVEGDGKPPAGGHYVNWHGGQEGDNWGLPYRDEVLELDTQQTQAEARREKQQARQNITPEILNREMTK